MAQQAQEEAGVKRLYLSGQDKKLAGLCGGIAEYFETDSSLIRLAWVILTAVTGVIPGVLAYIVAALVIPRNPAAPISSEKSP